MIMLVLTRAFVECTSAVAAPAHNPGGRRGDIALVLAAIGVFCIIATCANIAFQQMPLFRNGFGRRMLAICVAGLSTIALFFNPSTQKSFEQQPLRHHPNPVIEFILVPYAALALTLILLPLVFLLHRAWRYLMRLQDQRRKESESRSAFNANREGIRSKARKSEGLSQVKSLEHRKRIESRRQDISRKVGDPRNGIWNDG